jgi:type I restriction enzyme M protein
LTRNSYPRQARRFPLYGAKPPQTDAGRAFDYDELVNRDKVNLGIFWLQDKSIEGSDDLPNPDVLAQEIADDLQTAADNLRRSRLH